MGLSLVIAVGLIISLILSILLIILMESIFIMNLLKEYNKLKDIIMKININLFYFLLALKNSL